MGLYIGAGQQKNWNLNMFGVLLEDIWGYFGEGFEDMCGYLWEVFERKFDGLLEVI